MRTAVSVRLDEDAQRALSTLESTGLSRSAAIRHALLEAALNLRRRELLADEVRLLEADEVDRAEMIEVAAMMEGLRAEG
ncbi:MAG: hypothetical protein WCG96_03595 [Actinomycetes bacterium]